MEKLHKIIIGIVLIIFAVGLVFLYASTKQPNQSVSQIKSTQVIKYVPSTVSSSIKKESGDCFSSSIAAPYRQDAYRCMVGNAISDPCFQIPGSKDLLCGSDQVSANVTSTFLLSLIKDLPKFQIPSSIPANWAWRVQLSDGVICTPFTGTRPFTATGDVAIYACNGGANESMIFGDLNNTNPLWTAKVGSLSNSPNIFPPVITHSEIISVDKVWQ